MMYDVYWYCQMKKKANDYENFEKGMIYMKILKRGGGSREKGGEEETKSMPHAPVSFLWIIDCHFVCLSFFDGLRMICIW